MHERTSCCRLLAQEETTAQDGAVSGARISRLNGLIAGLPRLGPAEADAFLTDLKRLDADDHASDDPWAS